MYVNRNIIVLLKYVAALVVRDAELRSEPGSKMGFTLRPGRVERCVCVPVRNRDVMMVVVDI